jgi:hypothetical protein
MYGGEEEGDKSLYTHRPGTRKGSPITGPYILVLILWMEETACRYGPQFKIYSIGRGRSAASILAFG